MKNKNWKQRAALLAAFAAMAAPSAYAQLPTAIEDALEAQATTAVSAGNGAFAISVVIMLALITFAVIKNAFKKGTS